MIILIKYFNRSIFNVAEIRRSVSSKLNVATYIISRDIPYYVPRYGTMDVITLNLRSDEDLFFTRARLATFLRAESTSLIDRGYSVPFRIPVPSIRSYYARIFYVAFERIICPRSLILYLNQNFFRLNFY